MPEFKTGVVHANGLEHRTVWNSWKFKDLADRARHRVGALLC